MGDGIGENGRRARRGFTGAALRSGLRRYPREILAAFRRDQALRDPSEADLRGLVEHRFAASWLGHAAVLLRQGSMVVLTDPVFSERIGMRIGGRVIGPRRLIPAPDPGRLPPIDLIVVSHAHFDHLDRPTLASLASGRTIVVTAARTRRLIPRGFRHVIEMDWEESKEIGNVCVRALEPAHWGARAAIDRRRGYNSYIIESDGARSLFAGDTAETDAFGRAGSLDLAMLGIGAYDPWEHHHATPEQVWRMFKGMRAGRLLPIHHSTFELSDEHVDEPMERLLAAARPEEDRVVMLPPCGIWAAEGTADEGGRVHHARAG